MKKIKLLTLLLASTFFAISCAKKEEVKSSSIESIQAKQGVPVKVEVVKNQKFQKTLGFNSSVQGYEQVTIYSAVTDEVKELNVKIGDIVKKDQVLVVFPEDNPQAQYRQLKEQYDNVEKNYQRMKNLYAKGGISKQQYEEIETTFNVMKANLDSVEDMLFVKAPMDGIVTELNVFKNNTINAGKSMLTISKTKKLKGRIWIAESKISDVKKGMKVTASWRNLKTIGDITRVSKTMNPNLKAFAADVELHNGNHLIPAGVTMDIELISYENETAVVVPKRVVQKDGNRDFLWIVRNNEAVKTYVKIGGESKREVEILNGLNVGDQLIVEGYKMVRNNSLVAIVK